MPGAGDQVGLSNIYGDAVGRVGPVDVYALCTDVVKRNAGSGGDGAPLGVNNRLAQRELHGPKSFIGGQRRGIDRALRRSEGAPGLIRGVEEIGVLRFGLEANVAGRGQDQLRAVEFQNLQLVGLVDNRAAVELDVLIHRDGGGPAIGPIGKIGQSQCGGRIG